MGRKLGAVSFLGGAGSPSNTKSPGPRPTSIPSGILVHPAVWPQRIWAENWGAVPFFVAWAKAYVYAQFHDCAPFGGGQLGPHLTQCGLGQGLRPCQVSL